MRYIVHPRYVISRSDGDLHYVGFAQLCRLYGLNPGQGQVLNAQNMLGRKVQEDDVHLHVREDGDYRLPRRGDGKTDPA